MTLPAPDHAHGDYANVENYHGVPPELMVQPYVIDPASYKRTVPAAPPRPFAPVEEAPVVIAFP